MPKLPKIIVAAKTDEMDTPTLCSSARGVVTAGDPDVTAPPFTDVQLKAQADTTQGIHEQRITNKSPDLTRQEEVEVEKLEEMYKRDAQYVEDKANDVAKASGSVAAGEAVVLRCGFKLKQESHKAPREFEIIASGPGWMHIRVKSVGKRGGYVWRIGVTNTKGVIPTTFLPLFFTLECEMVITNLNSGSMYGIQFATILPASQSEATPGTQSDSISTSSSKPTFSAGADPLIWSDFIYEGCK